MGAFRRVVEENEVKENRRINLDQEFLGLFSREEMLAFFDFQLAWTAGKTLEGLCKVSKPRLGEGKSQYISLLFIIDTPGQGAREQAAASLLKIDWNAAMEAIPGVDSVLAMPYQATVPDTCWVECDVYLNPGVVVGRSYLSGRLIPAVARAIGAALGEVVFWDESSALPPGTPTQKAGNTLMERIRRLAGRRPD